MEISSWCASTRNATARDCIAIAGADSVTGHGRFTRCEGFAGYQAITGRDAFTGSESFPVNHAVIGTALIYVLLTKKAAMSIFIAAFL